MVKRALLVGCNYPGTGNALNGCVNDVKAQNKMLQESFGFAPSDIFTLIDTDPSGEQPTGVNMKRRLADLIASGEPGDVLFFHYSGHGTQVPSTDGEAAEADKMDEALVPTDLNLITDDDLRQILANLKDGVKFTMVADCCHSGTLLDQPNVEITGPKEDDPEPPPQLAGAIAAAAAGPASRACGGIRRLPTDQLALELGKRLGQDVKPAEVRAALVAAFGSDASAKLAPLIAKFHEQASARLDELIPGAGGVAGGLLGGLLESMAGAAGGEQQQCTNTRDGVGGTLFSLALDLLGQPEVQEQQACPQDQLPDGRVVLVTGCMSDETSADACPTGDLTQAFGALTNALTTVMHEFSTAYPDKHISARTLVVHVRDALEKQGYDQNPCLECDDAAADAAFVMG